MIQKIVQHLYKPSLDGRGVFYAWFSSMHTRVDLLFHSKMSEKELLLVADNIRLTLHRLERMANFFDPCSELSCANRLAGISSVVLSPELYSMIGLCLEYHCKTLGCFDIAIHSNPYTPDAIGAIHLSPQGNSLHFSRPGLSIDLSGFLKGYALEVIRDILKEAQIEDALVNMGNSSVLALGNHPAGEGWEVNHILLRNECLTTSGNDSTERKHIVSPNSGRYVEGVGQVSVVTSNGAVGEILSTALFAADKEQREALIAAFVEKEHLARNVYIK